MCTLGKRPIIKKGGKGNHPAIRGAVRQTPTLALSPLAVRFPGQPFQACSPLLPTTVPNSLSSWPGLSQQ